MEQWLKWAMEIQSLAQIGLTYTKDAFDKERYERLRDIAAEMIAHQTDFPVEKVKDLFCNETIPYSALCVLFCDCAKSPSLGVAWWHES